MAPTTLRRAVALIVVGAMAAACAPRNRMGMVAEAGTGLQYGSTVEKNIVIDASQLANRKIKLRIRNTSGDPEFDLKRFRGKLEAAYAANGYSPVSSDDFGTLIDINVVYSGQISRSLTSEFAFLGTSAGAIAGARSRARAGTAIGAVSGLALGAIIGSYVTEDTYIVVARVTLARVDPLRGGSKTKITFGTDRATEKEKDRIRRQGFKAFREAVTTGISVYAGGFNVPQARIAEGVRGRFVRILSDII